MSLSVSKAWVWALSICAAAAIAEAVMSGSRVKARLSELQLPRKTPPLWAWSIIGGAYYFLFFLILKSLLDRPPQPFWTSTALVLSATLLIANAGWNWVFFRKKDGWLSFVFFVPYLLLAVGFAFVLRRIRSELLIWWIVYLAYLLYATWWGFRVWRLNDATSTTVRH